MFSRALYILPSPLVFVSGLLTVSCQKKSKFSQKSLVKAFVVLCRNQESVRILQESIWIINIFSTALHPRYTACVYKWTWNCALPTNSKTFQKNLLKITKICFGSHDQYLPAPVTLCLYTLNWPFGAWASWKRGQSPYQFLAERRPLQKSFGGLIWRQWQLQKISNFSACITQDTQHKIRTAFSFVKRNKPHDPLPANLDYPDSLGNLDSWWDSHHEINEMQSLKLVKRFEFRSHMNAKQTFCLYFFTESDNWVIIKKN